VSEHVLEHLSAYLDGELGAAERERFRVHLGECATCAKRLDELASVDASLRDLPADAPAGYFEGLPSRVRSRLFQSAAPRRLWQVPAWTLAAAAALLLGVLAPLTLRQQRPAPAASVEQYALPVPSPAALEADKLAQAPEAKKLAEASQRADAAQPAPRGWAQAPAASTAEPAEPSGRLEAKAGTVGKAKAEASRPPPPARAPAAAPPAGFAEAPRQVAQATQEFGPRANQQADLRRQAPSKNADAQAETLEAEGRAEKRAADLKDAPAPAERALTKSDASPRRERAAALAASSRPLASSPAYRDLLARSPRDAAEARSLRETWRRLSATTADTAEADEARVRVIAMGVAAWRYERQAEDRASAEKDGTSYLARPDARQTARIRELLATLSR
jgi:hypothetical protein